MHLNTNDLYIIYTLYNLKNILILNLHDVLNCTWPAVKATIIKQSKIATKQTKWDISILLEAVYKKKFYYFNL